MRAVIYSRVSTDAQERDGTSLDTQEDSSREYARRHAGCDDMSKKVSAKHAPEQLRAMQMEYELEASSLLALRHAAEAYRKTRPELA